MNYMNLKITRGDSKTLKLKITDENTAITDFEKIYFTVKKDCYTDNIIFQKQLNSGITLKDNIYEIMINSTDTEELEYGRYEYDIEVIRGSLKETVVIGSLLVEKEVTFVINEA